MMAGTLAGQNVQHVKKGELQVRVHGITLFVGWTVPIPLLPAPYVLPPSCILFEVYGDPKAEKWAKIQPTGYRQEAECNSFEAFVTFMHPDSKYEWSGTEGILHRDYVMDAYPP